MGSGGHSPTRGDWQMKTKEVNAIRVTLLLDQEWFNAVSEMLQYAESGELVRWESVELAGLVEVDEYDEDEDEEDG